MDRKLPDLWIESEDTDPCPCCNFVVYKVCGLDKDGDSYESHGFMLREDAVELMVSMGGSDE